MLLKLAARNLFRQPTRTSLTIVAIAFGVASLIVTQGFIADLFIQLGEAIIHSQTGHIQTFRRDFLSRGTRQPENFLIEDRAGLETAMRRAEGVEQVSGRLYFSGLVNNGKRDLAIVGEGIEAEREVTIGKLLRITEGRALRADDAFGVLAGQGVAHALGLKPGDQVTLLANTIDGALNSADLTVIGVFQSFSKDYDARAIRVPLAAAQELIGTSSVNLLVATLSDTDRTDAAAAEVRRNIDAERFQAVTWHELSDFYDRSVALYDKQFGVLRWIILFMVLLSVVNSVNMSAFERQAEFGTLRALGNRPKTLFGLLMIEGVMLGLIGATVGAIVGMMMALGISAVGIPMPPPPNSNIGFTALVRISPSAVASAWCIGFAATVAASLIPLRRILRMPVIDALRQAI